MLFFTVEKLKARLAEMRTAIIRDTRPITGVFTCPAPGAPPITPWTRRPRPTILPGAR